MPRRHDTHDARACAHDTWPLGMLATTAPALVMKGTPLYVAMPSALVVRSGKSRSRIFFFGLTSSSGAAS